MFSLGGVWRANKFDSSLFEFLFRVSTVVIQTVREGFISSLDPGHPPVNAHHSLNVKGQRDPPSLPLWVISSGPSNIFLNCLYEHDCPHYCSLSMIPWY